MPVPIFSLLRRDSLEEPGSLTYHAIDDQRRDIHVVEPKLAFRRALDDFVRVLIVSFQLQQEQVVRRLAAVILVLGAFSSGFHPRQSNCEARRGVEKYSFFRKEGLRIYLGSAQCRRWKLSKMSQAGKPSQAVENERRRPQSHWARQQRSYLRFSCGKYSYPATGNPSAGYNSVRLSQVSHRPLLRLSILSSWPLFRHEKYLQSGHLRWYYYSDFAFSWRDQVLAEYWVCVCACK
jgi:hypothetical protein